jgi:hypothetical protein
MVFVFFLLCNCDMIPLMYTYRQFLRMAKLTPLTPETWIKGENRIRCPLSCSIQWMRFHRYLFLCWQTCNLYRFIGLAIIMSPKQSLEDILCLLRFLLLFFFFFFLSSAKSLSDTFLGDYWTEINETSQEC